MNVLRRFYEDYGARLGGQAFRSFEEVERALRKDGRLTRFLDRSWPAPKPEQVVRRLLGSREALAAAAGELLDRSEQVLLRRGRGGWSDADLPLIDEARDVLLDTSGRYGHVIVDEAQDLTPMQLRMIARRAAGAFTVLGDIAQATGPVAYGRWEELLPHLPGGERARLAFVLEHAVARAERARRDREQSVARCIRAVATGGGADRAGASSRERAGRGLACPDALPRERHRALVDLPAVEVAAALLGLGGLLLVRCRLRQFLVHHRLFADAGVVDEELVDLLAVGLDHAALAHAELL